MSEIKTRICEICKTELLPQDIDDVEGHKVHNGYCSQVMVEVLTQEYQKGLDGTQLNESVNNTASEYQLL